MGSGNLAWNLSKSLQKAGVSIVQVYSQKLENAELLAKDLNCRFTNDTTCIKEADIYISALKDSIGEIVWSKIDFKGKLLIHTSGSLDLNVLKSHSQNIGVIYPLMTLSKNRIVDFYNVPILIEANSIANLNLIESIAKAISNTVLRATSQQRAKMHLAAVWANNFSNHMFAVANKIAEENHIPFEFLLPLIDETTKKIHEMSPLKAQTGPAIRYDQNIIDKQIAECPTQFQNLYRIISESIHNLDINK